MLEYFIQFIRWALSFFWREIEPFKSNTVDYSHFAAEGQNRRESNWSNDSSDSDSPPNITLEYYELGGIKPVKITFSNGIITKRAICRAFHQAMFQEVLIFQGCMHVYTFERDENDNVEVDDRLLDLYESIYMNTTYIVVFDIKLHNMMMDRCNHYMTTVDYSLQLIAEMEKFEKEGGKRDIRHKKYPYINDLLEDIEDGELQWCTGRQRNDGFFGVGGSLPVLQGSGSVPKLALCAFFNQSFYQGVKIFFNNKLHSTASNHFELIHARALKDPSPRKYVVVFESDPIYHMTPTEAGNKLQQIEEEKLEKLLRKLEKYKGFLLEEEQKKKSGQEKREKIANIDTSPNMEEIRLFGYGDIKPIKIPHKGELSKILTCATFGHHMQQEIQIYCGSLCIHTFAADDKEADVFLDYGLYTVIFQSRDFPNEVLRMAVPINIAVMEEALKFENVQGKKLRKNRDIHCKENYPLINLILQDTMKDRHDAWKDGDGFYGRSSNEMLSAVLPGVKSVMKLLLCLLFKQSIFQEIKVFHNYKLHSTLSNNFDYIELSKRGKYEVMFESEYRGDSDFYIRKTLKKRVSRRRRAAEKILLDGEGKINA